MKAISIASSIHGSLEYGTMPVPVPSHGEVLIKVESAPINPSDIGLIEGRYSELLDLKLPYIPGFEGSGTVVRSGGGILPWYLLGRRVSFSKGNEKMREGSKLVMGGSYAQFIVTQATQCVPVNKDMSDNEAASVMINTFTALGLVEKVKRDGGKKVLITAAASHLGRIMIKLFQQNDIKVVATVRSKEQDYELRTKYGIRQVINSEGKHFESIINEQVHRMEIKHVLESIGGDRFGIIASNMPPDSKIILYGNLSKEQINGIDPMKMMYNRISIDTFNVNDWINEKNWFQKLLLVRKAKKMLSTYPRQEIHKEFDLKDIDSAIELYENKMSKGKVILKPWGVAQSKE